MTTLNNTRLPRKTLATQLDRLDVILDGLADALNGSVEDAVRGVVAQAVREAVAATLQEVLNQPDLLKAALARHAPEQIRAAKPRPSLRGLLGAARRAASGAASAAGLAAAHGLGWLSSRLRQARSWFLRRGGDVASGFRLAGRPCALAVGAVWSNPLRAAGAAAAGLLSGVAAYHAGAAAASLACGASGAVITALGSGRAWRPTTPGQ